MVVTTRSELGVAHSLMQLSGRKRANSEPRARAPNVDPWAIISESGIHPDQLHRTASALGELAVLTTGLPELKQGQIALAEAVAQDSLRIQTDSFQNGVRHGKWLREGEVREGKEGLDKIAALQSQLYELEVKHAILGGKYEEVKRLFALISNGESIEENA